MAPHQLNFDRKDFVHGEPYCVNIGFYGIPYKQHKRVLPTIALREAEQYLPKVGGRKMLYAHSYYPKGTQSIEIVRISVEFNFRKCSQVHKSQIHFLLSNQRSFGRFIPNTNTIRSGKSISFVIPKSSFTRQKYHAEDRFPSIFEKTCTEMPKWKILAPNFKVLSVVLYSLLLLVLTALVYTIFSLTEF